MDYFLRQHRRRAWRWDRPEAQANLSLLRQWRIRAGERILCPECGEGWDQIPADSAPLRRAFYVGRVEEITGSGGVQLHLLEAPSGRSICASLPPIAVDERRGPEPSVGDTIRVWTWVELPEAGVRRVRRFVEVIPRALSDAERKELEQIAKLLEDEAGD